VVPAKWKFANITPVFKKDDTTITSNYRPFSLLCVISKVLERCVFTVVPIEAFRKMLTNSFPNFKEHLWTGPQQFDKFLKKFVTSCFIDQSDCSKIKYKIWSNCWGIVQRCSFKLGNELVNIFRNASIGTTVITVIITSPLLSISTWISQG
jgi:hypothetical protein